MDFVIRNGTPDDYEGICEVFAEADAYHREALPDIFCEQKEPARSMGAVRFMSAEKGHVLFVAEADNRIIGLVHASIRTDEGLYPIQLQRYVYVGSIAVLEEYHRSGAGRALMERVHEWGRENNLDCVRLNVWNFNNKALAFYERLGYNTKIHSMWKSIK